jgi:hypothetical protein
MSGVLYVVLALALLLTALIWFIRSRARRRRIMHFRDAWGEDMCEEIWRRRIGAGMLMLQVQLAWGAPRYIDKREVTASGIHRERWVYGKARKNARYVYFKDGLVDKIQA